MARVGKNGVFLADQLLDEGVGKAPCRTTRKGAREHGVVPAGGDDRPLVGIGCTAFDTAATSSGVEGPPPIGAWITGLFRLRRRNGSLAAMSFCRIWLPDQGSNLGPAD
jgi:hypothetical protein